MHNRGTLAGAVVGALVLAAGAPAAQAGLHDDGTDFISLFSQTRGVNDTPRVLEPAEHRSVTITRRPDHLPGRRDESAVAAR
jgi:hypothetical protein